MSFSRMFPRALAACFVSGLFIATATAQDITRPRQVSVQTTPATTSQVNGRARLENDVFVISTAPTDEAEPETTSAAPARPAQLGQIEALMLGAIDERIGTPYRMGAVGPNRYDCSGFVWSVFQQAGIGFERMTARSLWSQFLPASEGEKFKFGTLVFFNNLHHVGIVADANGFYHASTSRGVVYSHFSDYWVKRISGFRRIPMPQSHPSFVAASVK